jgi:hypothetical protein
MYREQPLWPCPPAQAPTLGYARIKASVTQRKLCKALGVTASLHWAMRASRRRRQRQMGAARSWWGGAWAPAVWRRS